jgi:hypothetical protein
VKYVLVFTEQYERRARRFLQRHPELERQYLKSLLLQEANPFHPSLRLHRLYTGHGTHSANWMS